MEQTSPQETSAVAIGIAIVVHQGCVLVGTRSAGTHLEGLSEFPGGKSHPGESVASCAIRECFEETGLRVDVQELLMHHTHAYMERIVDLSFFLCALATPENAGDVSTPFEWVPIPQLSERQFPEGNRAVLQTLQDRWGTPPAQHSA